MVRTSASQSVDLGFIPLVESYQKTLGEVVKNKPASSLAVSLGKRHLTGRPRLHVEDR